MTPEQFHTELNKTNMEITFHGVTSKELWELMMAVKLRIKRLEQMLESDFATNDEKIEFMYELEIQRNWENRIMNAYLQLERLSEDIAKVVNSDKK